MGIIIILIVVVIVVVVVVVVVVGGVGRVHLLPPPLPLLSQLS